MYRVGISGSYGGLNLGDEAIVEGIIIKELRASVPAEITVFTRDATDTRRRHPVDGVVAVREFLRDEIVPFIEELGLQPPSFEGLNAGRLIARIDRAWDERALMKEKIARTLPTLQGRAREQRHRRRVVAEISAASGSHTGAGEERVRLMRRKVIAGAPTHCPLHGRRTVNTLPLPRPSLCAAMLPPCCSTIARTSGKPRPSPPPDLALAGEA